jgi:hypothetical protein
VISLILPNVLFSYDTSKFLRMLRKPLLCIPLLRPNLTLRTCKCAVIKMQERAESVKMWAGVMDICQVIKRAKFCDLLSFNMYAMSFCCPDDFMSVLFCCLI